MQVLQSEEPHSCLEYFAKAVEIDELGCGWKQKFETKLEQIGEFFTLEPKDDRNKYYSMLAGTCMARPCLHAAGDAYPFTFINPACALTKLTTTSPATTACFRMCVLWCCSTPWPAKEHRCCSFDMLAEAYMVVMLQTVVNLYGKDESDLQEDFDVVKTRLNVCVKLQVCRLAVSCVA